MMKGHTNIYTLFMALGEKALAQNGRACYIVPRSFCSGAYFSAFRHAFIKHAFPTDIHLFASRQDAFKSDSVLQENVIFTFRKRRPTESESDHHINISTSSSASDLGKEPANRKVSMAHFLGRQNGALFFRLPTSELDEKIIDAVDRWSGSFEQYGLKISTDPVVPFRATPFLLKATATEQGKAVPLLWMQNVVQQRVDWPVTHRDKAQSISTSEGARHLLLPAANYVLVRRFSAKEERRRLIAAPFLRDSYDYPHVGLENHLNYIHRPQGKLDATEAVGLSALLNSAIIDRYFRIANGHTQVNAAELQALPLPPLKIIKQIGVQISKGGGALSDGIVFAALREARYLPSNIPTIKETRITMGKIQEAQDVLKTLGLPEKQQNEMAALTLLVLAQLSEETPWAQAKRPSLRIHDILVEIKKRYGREYAENTRETIRRQVIHQFVQAALVLRNPDEPALSTNSPRTHYALSDPALKAIGSYGVQTGQKKQSRSLRTKCP